MRLRSLPQRDLFIWRAIEKKQFCLITLQKYTSLGYRKVESLQEDIPKNYDGGLSTEPTFKL